MGTFKRISKVSGDYARGFIFEDGRAIRHERQELAPTIKRVERFRRLQGRSPNEWRHVGSIPMTVLIDWLTKTGHTIDQWARNDGGTPCPPGADPVQHIQRDPGVKSQFLRHFLSRDFSKLHNVHVTTKRESSAIVVPEYLRRRNREHDTRRAEGSDS